MRKYDVVVLGAGPGGYVSAIKAAQMGAKTAIIEKEHIGGTCLNVGCIPTKALIKNVEILHSIEIGKKRGIKIDGEIVLDYKKAVKAKDKAVRQLVSGVEGLLGSHGIDIYRGKGFVRDNNIIDIEDESGESNAIEFDKLIIATGSAPTIPPIKGADIEGVMTNEGMLAEDSVPKHLIIIGGGVIGCEFASIFKAYGSEVTIIEMLPVLVSMLDKDISNYMGNSMSDLGVEIKLEQQVTEILKNDGGFEVSITSKDGDKEVLRGDKVLISVGRKPNTLGLESLDLRMERGFISVNDQLETNVPGVYAIGDVTGKKTLAHVASEMGVIAAENAMGYKKEMKLDIVPSCIYTIPEVGSVGLSEKEAHEKGIDIIIGTFPLMACGKAVATGEPEGIFKIIAEKNTRKLLGAHFIGKSATEIIAEATAYLKMGATIDDIVNTIHAHPTISESVMEAARDVDGCAIHMPNSNRTIEHN